MDDDRKASLPGAGNLRLKYGLLHVPRREIVMVVKADFPDGAAPGVRLQTLCHESNSPLRITGKGSRLMGVYADRHSDLGPRFDHTVRPGTLPLVSGGQDDERASHPCGVRPLDHCRQVGLKLLARQVAMRINHRTRAPGAMS